MKGAPLGRLVLVGGVHGVGKSRFCESWARSLGIQHVSAGRFVRRLTDDSRTVAQIGRDQTRIVTRLLTLSRTVPLLLADGHFALLKGREVVPVPTRFFAQLPLSALLVLVDTPSAIARRLQRRSSGEHPLSLIAALQRCELEQAMKVSQDRVLPLMIVPVRAPPKHVLPFLQTLIKPVRRPRPH